MMRIGVVYPQTEFGNDPIEIRDYAQIAEGLGYTHILAYDHVLGANPNRPGWSGGYTYLSPFHEPFVLFSFLAGITNRIEFVTGVLVLPQRQTALVAKQAATLDVLSGGRLRVGIGVGWNAVEFKSLGLNFHDRGKRIEEQIVVLKSLWSSPLVDFDGRWHNIPDAGLSPLPNRNYIPLWMGGHSDVVLNRAVKFCDGWMPNYKTCADAQRALDVIFQALEVEGRDKSDFGIEVRLDYKDGKPERWHQLMQEWGAVGATHFCINTMGSGFVEPRQHIDAIKKFAVSVGLESKT